MEWIRTSGRQLSSPEARAEPFRGELHRIAIKVTRRFTQLGSLIAIGNGEPPRAYIRRIDSSRQLESASPLHYQLGSDSNLCTNGRFFWRSAGNVGVHRSSELDGGAGARLDHPITEPQPGRNSALRRALIDTANPLASSSVRFPLDETADAGNSRRRHLRGQHDDHEIR